MTPRLSNQPSNQSPNQTNQHRHYLQIARVIEYCTEHQSQQPTLDQLANHAGLSESRLQRVFSEWVGVSPKQFLKYLTKEQAKARLRRETVLDSALGSGLSGSGRLHDLMITCEGVTPGEYRNWGEGLLIEYGFHDTPFGQCLLAQTQRGVCGLTFFDEEEQHQEQLETLRVQWPNAELSQDQNGTGATIQRIFPGVIELDSTQPRNLRLLMKGSPFQLKVWEALLAIPGGELCSYQQIAEQIQAPAAVRAVASAIARNHIGYLIPCHRVIRSSGEINQYRWGAVRKKMMIGWEARFSV